MEDQLRRDRKYKTFGAMFTLSAIFLYFDKLTGSQYVEIMVFVFGLYMAGNVGEHLSNALDKKPTSETTGSADFS